jgi:hypothetical protein
MAPYNSHYGTRYDPVGSQYNQQHHQNYYTPNSNQPASQQDRPTTQTPQTQPSAPSTYQSSYTAAYSNQPYYNYPSTESRAAETLSHLSAQEHTSPPTRSANPQYETNSRSDSSWNTSDRPSTQQHHSSATTSTSWHNTDRRAANPSPLYQQETRSSTTAANYSPAQSYPQPAINNDTYSYSSYTQSEQPRAHTTTSNQPTSYDYSASNFRPNSPYIARQQQQPSNPRSSISSVTSTAPRDHHLTATAASANVGQPRAPSVTPSSVQQRASSSYAHHSNPSDQGYGSGPTTVDPVQVYDPWPEQQRKLAEARRKAEAEEKRRAEEEAKTKAEEDAKRKAEEEVKRKAEEEIRKKAEEEARKKAEEEAKRKAAEEAKRKAEEYRKAEEKRKEEAQKAESLRLSRAMADREAVRRRQQEQQKEQQQRPALVTPAVTTVQDTQRMMVAAMMAGGASGGGNGGGLETEMAAIFRKMRDLNQADPQMFARMWETERQAHLTKSQGNTPAPAPAPAPARVPAPVQRSQGPARPVFSPAPTQAPQAPMVSAPPTRPPVPVPRSATAGPSNVSQSNTRNVPPPPGGPNPHWPPGKKATLAETATRWLNARPENLSKLVSVEEIHALIVPNPSYMMLCEGLERMGLYVDRAQFARALLSVVPDAAKAKPASPALPSAQPPAAAITPSSSAQVTPKSTPASQKWPNIGKFPGQRGRPSRAALAALQDQNVVDLTGRDSVPPTTSGPPVSRPYYSGAHPVDAPIVNYQAQWAPADDVPSYPTSYTPPQPQPQHLEQHHQQEQQRAAIMKLQDQHRKYSSPYFQQTAQAANMVRPTPPPAGPRPPPANKGEAARKRNFAELVDMTAMDSDSDEDMPSAKQINTGQQDTGMASESVNNVHSNGHFNPSVPPNLQQYYFGGQYHPITAPVPSSAAASLRPMVISKHMELKNQILVEPVRRAKVARKSRYDPRTICRDVLLATGRHPDMRPLNQHLNVMHNFLKLHSKDVEQDKFDLDTIRWDLVDPGEPIDEPLESAEADRESTIEAETNERNAVDADDEGGSEDEGGAPLTSDVPPVTARASTTESTPAPSLSGRHGSTSQLVAVEIDTNRGKPSRFRKPFPNPKRKSDRQSLPATATATVNVSNGKSSAKPSTRRHTEAHQRATSSETPRKQQTPNMSATPIPDKPVGYAAFRSAVTEYDENGNPIKRKGRPVGWRKSVHSKAALAAAGGESGDGATPKSSAAQRTARGQAVPSYAPPKQRRGRPAKPVVEAKEPEVKFNVYKCEWEDCGAELHNIDTLRKHVLKLHGKKTVEGDYECAWAGCFQEDEVTAFDDMATWMEHMESQHVKPITRKLGDGPRSGLSGGS